MVKYSEKQIQRWVSVCCLLWYVSSSFTQLSTLLTNRASRPATSHRTAFHNALHYFPSWSHSSNWMCPASSARPLFSPSLQDSWLVTQLSSSRSPFGPLLPELLIIQILIPIINFSFYNTHGGFASLIDS